MKKKVLFVLYVIFAIGLLSSLALADTNPDDNYDDSLGGGSFVSVTLSTTYYGTCWYDEVFAGSIGWSEETWVLTITDEYGMGIEIHAFDRFWVGDFYGVYIVDTVAGTVDLLFTTPEVETDWHHGSATYPCPVGDPLHTGVGTVYSDGTYYWFFNPGTYEIKVRNELAQKLIAEGLDPRSPPWLPSGFYIGFHAAPEVIPEVPLGTVMSAVVMIVALFAYIGTKHTQVFLRRP